MTGLGERIAPIGCDRADNDALAGLETVDLGADFMDDADGLVTEGEVFAGADGTVNGVRIGGADEGHRGLDDSVVGAGPGNELIREADVVETFHHKCLHGRWLLSELMGVTAFTEGMLRALAGSNAFQWRGKG